MNVRFRTLAWVAAAAAIVFLSMLALQTLRSGPQGMGRRGGFDQKGAQGLADFGRVPPFSLIERNGRPLTREDLDGRIWVANFIYTSCRDTCPLQSQALAGLQTQWGSELNVVLVSITVDPERDTPAVLSRYADRFGADPQRWFFLTGSKDAIFQLAREGFRLNAAPAEVKSGGDNKDFIHSARFVLVDGSATIRGYYPSSDPEALRQLSRDVKILWQRGSNHA
jgi:protein SCO1